jgi:hypothetical protein
MRLFPISIERIIADNRVTDVIFRRTWSWRDYALQYVYIFVILAILFISDYSMKILLVPLWVYGFICIMYISVRIAFNITANRDAAEKEDKIIEYILNENTAEDEVYCHDEIKDMLLMQSQINTAHEAPVEMEFWDNRVNQI